MTAITTILTIRPQLSLSLEVPHGLQGLHDLPSFTEGRAASFLICWTLSGTGLLPILVPLLSSCLCILDLSPLVTSSRRLSASLFIPIPSAWPKYEAPQDSRQLSRVPDIVLIPISQPQEGDWKAYGKLKKVTGKFQKIHLLNSAEATGRWPEAAAYKNWGPALSKTLHLLLGCLPLTAPGFKVRPLLPSPGAGCCERRALG